MKEVSGLFAIYNYGHGGIDYMYRIGEINIGIQLSEKTFIKIRHRNSIGVRGILECATGIMR